MCRRTRLSSDASEINFVAGSAAALRKALAMSLPDPAKNRLEQNLDAARQALTGSAATASWMRGWSMPIEEAVRLAMANK